MTAVEPETYGRDADAGGAGANGGAETEYDDAALQRAEALFQPGQRARINGVPAVGGGLRLTTGAMVNRWRQHHRHVAIRELEVERERRQAYGPAITVTQLVDEEVRPLARLRAEHAHAAGSSEMRDARATTERARWHHEIWWDRDAEWRRVHDEECSDCKEAPAHYFGLDEDTMRQVRANPRSTRARREGVRKSTPRTREVKRARDAPVKPVTLWYDAVAEPRWDSGPDRGGGGPEASTWRRFSTGHGTSRRRHGREGRDASSGEGGAGA